MSKSSIEWTEFTWNPIVGCEKISTGCKNCYSEVMTKRLQNMNPASAEKYKGTLDDRGNFNGTINFDEKALLEPLKRKKPTTYFMSMSDLFHKNVKWEWIDKIFAVMALTPHHTYQILTKRPERMLEYFEQKRPIVVRGREFEGVKAFYKEYYKSGKITNFQNVGSVKGEHGEIDFEYLYSGELPLPNVWLGTSVENPNQIKRVIDLLKVPAAVRFLSLEPLLAYVALNVIYDKETDLIIDSLTGDVFSLPKGTDTLHPHSETNKIDWVIVGGESGHNARPMHPDWVRKIMKDCKEANVPFFFKQWGEYLPLVQKDGFILDFKIDTHLNEYGDSDLKIERGHYIGFSKVGKKAAGNYLDGKQYLEMPNHYDK